MKKIIRTNFKVILAFILGGLIFSGIGIYAASLSFASGDVDHIKNDGTTTTVEEALNELYAKSESGKVIDLGTGTSFDVSSYSGYQNFTVNNFLIIPSVSKSGSARGGGTEEGSYGHTLSTSTTLTPSYNASTGVYQVKCRLYAHAQFRNHSGDSTYDNTTDVSVHAYLIK